MPDWSRDELIVALEFFYKCPERMHTDAHAKCKQVAATVGHTPGALDRVIRNIKYVTTGGTGLAHASQAIHDLVAEFKDNPSQLYSEASAVRAANNWPPLNCEG
jgi:hypothetical protein